MLTAKGPFIMNLGPDDGAQKTLATHTLQLRTWLRVSLTVIIARFLFF
jgi:hypothetical protein